MPEEPGSLPLPGQARRLSVRWLPIEQVRPYPDNPRTCPQEAIDLVATSIAQYGFLQPITTDEKLVILTGHTRRLAALQLGLTKVPVIVVAGLTAAQARAYRLMDNRSHEATSWNTELLQSELAALVGMEIDPALTGFSAAGAGRAAGPGSRRHPRPLRPRPARRAAGQAQLSDPARCVCWAVIA